MSTFRQATIGEYIDWLRGHLAQGGQITHVYDYPLPGFLTAQRDFTTGGECGTDSRQIVVPANVRHRGGDLGHNNLFFMDGFTCAGLAIVPVYADPEFNAVPGIDDARSREAKRDTEFERRIQRRLTESAARARHSDLGAYRPAEPAVRTTHTVHADEPVTVNVERDGTVVLLPRSMPTRLTPDEAETLAYRILAASGRSPE